ncbi:glycosyltransferase [Tateyamaria sp.]|uniref:glycosyltransferase n=1 Tax=Tateyamaria sp. TaxID=1929288 RepID=UPI00329D7589
MKILFYNWVDYLDDEKRGGGVTVYQRNTIQAMRAEDGISCVFLSSGISYDVLQSGPRWERIKHGPSEDRDIRFEIVNSGVLAPSHHSFGDERQTTEPATTEVFMDFLRKNGPFDVVHFNNLEGLPADVLKLKEHFPETRVIFSLHNYYPVCPQVNLWHQERENCVDFDNGRKCEQCLPHQHDTRIIELANGVAFNLKKRGVRPGSKMFDRGFGPAMRLAGRAVGFYNRRIRKGNGRQIPQVASPTTHSTLLRKVERSHLKFARRRDAMVEAINTHCDKVLCVSDRVGVVASKFGIAPALIQTGYIGTQHASKYSETSPKSTLTKPDGTLTLAFLGYMRHDKGFFFLLDTLETTPADIAARINIVICSRLLDQHCMDRITALSDRFASVLFADGYAHNQLDELLSDVDLGVIPVLWEDNLPQVAIEMHARHIPLLTSDLGGAQELGNTAEFTFKADDSADFIRKIQAMLDGEVWLEEYWQNAMAPYSMDDHLRELKDVYAQPARPIALMASATPETNEDDDADPVEDPFAGLSDEEIEAAELRASQEG